MFESKKFLWSSVHPEKGTIWRTLWSKGVIGPYFFENDDGSTITVDSERHGDMITDFFYLKKNTRGCHMPHNSSEYGFIARDISWPRNFSSYRYNWPLDFFMGLRERLRLCTLTLKRLKTNIRQYHPICFKILKSKITSKEVLRVALHT